MQTNRIRLSESRMLSTNTRWCRFETITPNALHFRPGEFIALHLQDAQGEFKRSYSIANLSNNPDGNSSLEIVASFVEGGRATHWLWQAPIGSECEYSGPHGQLLVPDVLPTRLFLVATGTGLAPYRAMLMQAQERLAAMPGAQIFVLFGVRTRAEAFFLDDFRALAAAEPRFQFRLCLSREAPAADDECQSRVSTALTDYSPSAETDLVYLCGNPAMVDEVYEAMKIRGFTFRNVKREKYVFTRT